MAAGVSTLLSAFVRLDSIASRVADLLSLDDGTLTRVIKSVNICLCGLKANAKYIITEAPCLLKAPCYIITCYSRLPQHILMKLKGYY